MVSWKGKNQNRLTTMFLAIFDKEKPLWSNGFDFFLFINKNREGFGEGWEPLPELKEGSGGEQRSQTAPVRKNPYM